MVLVQKNNAIVFKIHVQKLPQQLEETHAINGRGNRTQINTPNTDNMRFELQTKHINRSWKREQN